MNNGKLLNSEDILHIYKEKFGKDADYFKLSAVLREMRETEEPATLEAFEKAWDEEKTFERIAFEAVEERDLIKFAFRTGYDTCDVCANAAIGENCEESDCDCRSCGYENCVCKRCVVNCNNEFILDIEKARSLLEKEKEWEKEDGEEHS